LYNILSKFGIRMQLVRLVEMHLNGTYSYVWLGKHMSDKLPNKNGLKCGEALLPVFALDYATQKVQTNQKGLN